MRDYGIESHAKARREEEVSVTGYLSRLRKDWRGGECNRVSLSLNGEAWLLAMTRGDNDALGHELS